MCVCVCVCGSGEAPPISRSGASVRPVTEKGGEEVAASLCLIFCGIETLLGKPSEGKNKEPTRRWSHRVEVSGAGKRRRGDEDCNVSENHLQEFLSGSFWQRNSTSFSFARLQLPCLHARGYPWSATEHMKKRTFALTLRVRSSLLLFLQSCIAFGRNGNSQFDSC